jgi:hypothetical protein
MQRGTLSIAGPSMAKEENNIVRKNIPHKDLRHTLKNTSPR